MLLEYVLYIPRAALVAGLGLSAASANPPPAGTVRVLEWEDWTCGGALLRFSTYTYMRLQVATFGSRVAVMSHCMQSDGGPLASPAIHVFEVHPWAHASNIHPQSSADGPEEIDFADETEGSVARPKEPLQFDVSHRAVVQEGDIVSRSSTESMLLLEDRLVLLVRLVFPEHVDR